MPTKMHGFGPNGELSPGAAAALGGLGSGGGGGGVTDHGALSGLDDDDHPQYHTDARGDVRYYTKSQTDALLSGATPVPAAGGYDVILLAGQSNMVGWSTTGSTDLTDPVHPMIDYVDCLGSNGDLGVIKPATRSMDFRSGVGGISPGLHFARWYISSGLNHGRKVLLVASAASNTPLVDLSTAATWNPNRAGSSLYLDSLARVSDALDVEGSTMKAILWVQGESDGVDGVTGPEYQAVLDDLIESYRTDIPGASTVPFVIGQMVPDYLNAARLPIDAVQRTVAQRLQFTGFAYGPSGSVFGQGDGNHYSQTGSRVLGRNMFDVYERIMVGLPEPDRSYRPVIVSATAPSDRTAVWVDHSGVAEPVKLWNGTAWVPASTGYAATTTTTTTAAGTTTTTTTAATTTTTTTEGTTTTTTTSSWTPADLPNLDLWLDASTLTGLSEGDPVALWEDLSPAGDDATQATGAAQPLYTTANGYPALSFNGSMWMDSPADASAVPQTVVAVSRIPAAAGSTRTAVGGSSNVSMVLNWTNIGHVQYWAPGASPGLGVVQNPGIPDREAKWTILGGYYDGANIAAFHNAVAPTVESEASTLATPRTVRIGRHGSTNSLVGEVAEVIRCAGVLSEADRGSLVAYLIGKYSIT